MLSEGTETKPVRFDQYKFCTNKIHCRPSHLKNGLRKMCSDKVKGAMRVDVWQKNQVACQGFVEFELEEDMEAIRSEFNLTDLTTFCPEMVCKTKADKLVHLIPCDAEAKAIRKGWKNTCVMKNVPAGVTLRELYETLSEFGQVIDVYKDWSGMIYCQFRSEEIAGTIIEDLNGGQIRGSTISLESFNPAIAKDGTEEHTFRDVYIKNVSITTDDELCAYASNFGTVEDAHVHGTSGFVKMSTHEEAVKLIEGINAESKEKNMTRVASRKQDQKSYKKSMDLRNIPNN